MTRRTFLRRFLLCAQFLPSSLYASSLSVAQGTLDRSKQPPIGKPPELRVPTWTKSKLSNGAELIVSEKHDLPLVSFSITFLGGADQFETADKRGVAGLTASMLNEGTKTRDGEALSNALQLLGTSVSVGIGSENGSISFVSTTAKFAPTLDILADMLLNSTFPPEALERLRAQRLVALNQAKAQPGAIAGRVFPRVALRRRASVWPGADGSLGEGDHASRCCRVSPELFQAGTRAYHRRRRCHTGGGATGHRTRSGRVVQRRRTSVVHPPNAAGRTHDDDLSRRQAGIRAIDVRDWASGAAAKHARLFCAAGHEHDPRRNVPGAA